MTFKSTLAALTLLALVCTSFAQAKTVAAIDNAWVLNGSGDQSEATSLSLNGNSRIAYLRFNVSTLNVASNDLVYLDLYLTCPVNSDARQLHLDALNDGTTGETTWSASMTYAARPDGTGGLPNANTSFITTYDGRVMQQTAGSSGPRNKENPPGQISILINSITMQSLLANDTNGELTLILYGAQNTSTISSLNGSNLKPQLRVLDDARIEKVSGSTHGGEISSGNWITGGTSAQVGRGPCHIMVFELPKQPKGGFDAGDTSFETTLSANDIYPGNWGLAQADVWAIGYVPASGVPLLENDVNDYLLETDTAAEVGWNTGTNQTIKIYNNLTSPYSSVGQRFVIPPSACTTLTDYINGLYENHGATHGDYLIMRVNADASPDNGQEFRFNTGDAAHGLKPTLVLSAFPSGTVITLY